jgi:hypothetical protein
MQTFRQSICLRTHSATAGQSAWEETEWSADPCLIYFRATDRVTGITRTDTVRIGSASIRFREEWKRTVTFQSNALPTMHTSPFRRRLRLVANMTSSHRCQEIFLLRDSLFLVYPEDRGSKFLQNSGTYIRKYKASYLRRPTVSLAHSYLLRSRMRIIFIFCNHQNVFGQKNVNQNFLDFFSSWSFVQRGEELKVTLNW